MIPDTLPCLIYVVLAFAFGAFCDRVFRPARRVVDHRSDKERRVEE